MIYVTGDIHGNIDIRKLNADRFPQQKEMTKEDYVIICGDFGLVWDGSNEEKYWRKWLSEKNFTTLFIDGNHENFPLLRSFPTSEKFGGVVREVAPSVFHLERGQVLTIDGNTFFTMGGAASHDKEWRTEGVSWWREEVPSIEEMQRGFNALGKIGWKVDYVLTHTVPKDLRPLLGWGAVCDREADPTESYLNNIYSGLDFKRWYFGHYHIDRQINSQFIALYNRIVPLGGEYRV